MTLRFNFCRYAADDVLINGKSTGACSVGGNNTLGKCLIFTDTGAPITSVPPELVDSESSTAFKNWLNTDSYNPDIPVYPCEHMGSVPFNITIVVEGVSFAVNVADLAVEIQDGVCGSIVEVSSLQSQFTDPSDPFYNLPAPAVFTGNNWLRNFYMTFGLPNSKGTPYITLGCGRGGRGKCRAVGDPQ